MKLEARIMNLPTSSLIEGWNQAERHNYKMGHRDARHAAAALAAAHDALMQQMAEALELARTEMIDSGNWFATDYGWPKACESVDAALRAYKEQQ